MLVAAFWSIDDFTGKIIKTTTLDNFRTLVQDPVYRRIAVRTAVQASKPQRVAHTRTHVNPPWGTS